MFQKWLPPRPDDKGVGHKKSWWNIFPRSLTKVTAFQDQVWFEPFWFQMRVFPEKTDQGTQWRRTHFFEYYRTVVHKNRPALTLEMWETWPEVRWNGKDWWKRAHFLAHYPVDGELRWHFAAPPFEFNCRGELVNPPDQLTWSKDSDPPPLELLAELKERGHDRILKKYQKRMESYWLPRWQARNAAAPWCNGPWQQHEQDLLHKRLHCILRQVDYMKQRVRRAVADNIEQLKAAGKYDAESVKVSWSPPGCPTCDQVFEQMIDDAIKELITLGTLEFAGFDGAELSDAMNQSKEMSRAINAVLLFVSPNDAYSFDSGVINAFLTPALGHDLDPLRLEGIPLVHCLIFRAQMKHKMVVPGPGLCGLPTGGRLEEFKVIWNETQARARRNVAKEARQMQKQQAAAAAPAAPQAPQSSSRPPPTYVQGQVLEVKRSNGEWHPCRIREVNYQTQRYTVAVLHPETLVETGVSKEILTIDQDALLRPQGTPQWQPQLMATPAAPVAAQSDFAAWQAKQRQGTPQSQPQQGKSSPPAALQVKGGKGVLHEAKGGKGKGEGAMRERTPEEEAAFYAAMMEPDDSSSESQDWEPPEPVDPKAAAAAADAKRRLSMYDYQCRPYVSKQQKLLVPPEQYISLPVTGRMPELLKHIQRNRLTFIQAETGSGKSTQIPKWLMRNGPSNSILVCQPRRVAAKSLALRVSRELNEPVAGGLVGYRIGQDCSASADHTRLVYVTTGWMLNALLGTPNSLFKLTHLILDEAHERDLDLDLICCLVLHMLQCAQTDPQAPKGPKIIVMSATLDSSLRSYLNPISGEVQLQVPFSIRGRVHDVTRYWIEDMRAIMPEYKDIFQEYADMYASAARQVQDWQQRAKHKAASTGGRITALQKVRFHKEALARDIISWLAGPDGVSMVTKAAKMFKGTTILIFLPGIREIQEVYEGLSGPLDRMRGKPDKPQCKLFMVHSTLDHEEQEACMRPPENGENHIVLSTNMCESSVTLPDVSVVIDAGLQKHLTFSEDTSVSQLQMGMASRNSSKQRAGRAGRTMPGVAFHLFPKHCELHPECDVPESRRVSVSAALLKVMNMYKGAQHFLGKCEIPSPKEFLLALPDPPAESRIDAAQRELWHNGFILRDSNCSSLTAFGVLATRLPLDLALGKLICFGILHGLPREATIMACGIASQKEPGFYVPMPYGKAADSFVRKLYESSQSRELFDAGVRSEPIAAYGVFLEFIHSWKRGPREFHSHSKRFSRDFDMVPEVLRNFVIQVGEVAKLSAAIVEGELEPEKRLTQKKFLDLRKAATTGADFAEPLCMDPTRLKALLAMGFACQNLIGAHGGKNHWGALPDDCDLKQLFNGQSMGSVLFDGVSEELFGDMAAIVRGMIGLKIDGTASIARPTVTKASCNNDGTSTVLVTMQKEDAPPKDQSTTRRKTTKDLHWERPQPWLSRCRDTCPSRPREHPDHVNRLIRYCLGRDNVKVSYQDPKTGCKKTTMIQAPQAPFAIKWHRPGTRGYVKLDTRSPLGTMCHIPGSADPWEDYGKCRFMAVCSSLQKTGRTSMRANGTTVLPATWWPFIAAAVPADTARFVFRRVEQWDDSEYQRRPKDRRPTPKEQVGKNKDEVVGLCMGAGGKLFTTGVRYPDDTVKQVNEMRSALWAAIRSRYRLTQCQDCTRQFEALIDLVSRARSLSDYEKDYNSWGEYITCSNKRVPSYPAPYPERMWCHSFRPFDVKIPDDVKTSRVPPKNIRWDAVHDAVERGEPVPQLLIKWNSDEADAASVAANDEDDRDLAQEDV